MGTKETLNSKDIFDLVWDDNAQLREGLELVSDKAMVVTQLKLFLYHFQSIADICMATDDENECYQIDGGVHFLDDEFQSIKSIIEGACEKREAELADLISNLSLPDSVCGKNIKVDE